MKNLILFSVILLASVVLAQMQQPAGVPSATTPGTINRPGTTTPSNAVGAVPGTMNNGTMNNGPVNNNAGATVNTVAGPCNPNIPGVVAPLSTTGSMPGAPTAGATTSVPTTGIPAVGATAGSPIGTNTVIGNTNLNSPGPTVGTNTVAQPCVLGPATVLPTPLPSPTP